MLFGWFSADTRDTAAVLESMAAALRVTPAEQVALWTAGMVGIGIVERPVAHEPFSREPARLADGSCLWMTGEAFDWPSHGGTRGAAESRTLAFRSRLLDAITAISIMPQPVPTNSPMKNPTTMLTSAANADAAHRPVACPAS